ncbi:Bud site selection protein bud4 [Puccinia graminis f. sp. tritici]|uniref:Bud site selection protein bud4 n=1 Tax=Puccinia graminis f. sp. tritici TaxID=56615 RepID=A0A5B0NEK1_PUCGR|nr:Bud site selection protein bud4 [Puccinia graminis f. sp. tritici]KAA1087032.1 Bud site selection protein bud4 [Puccinia graminis f. sp. tritici]
MTQRENHLLVVTASGESDLQSLAAAPRHSEAVKRQAGAPGVLKVKWQLLSAADTHRILPPMHPLLNPTLSNPLEANYKPGTKRTSDENQPIPPRPPPNLRLPAPLLQMLNQMNQKARPATSLMFLRATL